MSALTPAPGSALLTHRFLPAFQRRLACQLRLAFQLLLTEWRAHPVRALVSIAAIATGVALGFAIHLINGAAFNEFSSTLKSLAGQADIQVVATEARFDERIYPQLAERAGVALASPLLEIDAGLAGRAGTGTLKIIALDAMRAGQIAPDLIGVPAPDRPFDMLADDALFLSPAAREWLGSESTSTSTFAPQAIVRLRSGTDNIALRLAGTILRARVGQRLGVMDLGAAQWRFDLLGQLSRIDLRLQDGVDRDAFQRQLTRELERDYPGRFIVSQPGDENQNSRNDNLSRAYRVNLTVLALVALFTGAFLVFSTQALSVMRRRSQFALLRVLGMGRAQLLRQVLLEGASLGIAGAALGIAAGYAVAAAALHFFGGDLGAGYFSGVQPSVQWTPLAALGYFGLGLGVALLGCAAPAWEAARAAPAAALKSGSAETALAPLARAWPALACLALAALLTLAPPVFELPLPAYLAIALLLIGAIALMPQLAKRVFGLANRLAEQRWRGEKNPSTMHSTQSMQNTDSPRSVIAALTLARLANASGQAAIALGGVLASFSLMVAMAIMVSSFRSSVDDWLLQILPADLYARAAAGSTSGLTLPQQAALQALPGIASVDFLRNRPLTLAPDRPDVALLARMIDPRAPGAAMVMLGQPLSVPPGSKPVWVSEAMVDLYGAKPGSRIALPLGGRSHVFFVAGVWRDYAHQGGAVQIRLADYRLLSNDDSVNDAAIALAPDVTLEQARARIEALPFGAALTLTAPSEIRAISLKIFDRSFAVTYLLEAIAIVIGLFGVAATFSAQTLARSREFGMLRHIGVTQRQILALLALEGGALTGLGIASGFLLGWIISLILVFIVNPQSFHWSMQLHVPWAMLATVAGALLAAAALTALLAGRAALSGSPVQAVREDS